jgi:rhomboid protease GluP
MTPDEENLTPAAAPEAAPPADTAPPERRGEFAHLSTFPEPAEAARPATPREEMAEFHRSLAALTPRVRVTPLIVALNVLIFIVMVASGLSPVSPKPQEMLHWGANYGPLTISGEWWRLLTCVFLHYGVFHLAFNMLFFVGAGMVVERMVGNVGFSLLYLVAGLVGSLASLLWNPAVVGAGASGAIFGVYGAQIVLLLRNRDSIPPGALIQLRNSGLAFVGYNLVFGMMHEGTDSAAHIGGLVGGIICGAVLSQPLTREGLGRRLPANFAVAGLGIVLVMGGMAGLHAVFSANPAVSQNRVQRGGIEVFYGGGTTAAEADRLAAYLEKSWGQANDRATVKLDKSPAGWQMHMVVKPEHREDAETLAAIQIDVARVSRDVFDGAAVETHVCDERMRSVKVLPPRADVRYGIVDGKAEVFFPEEANRSDAQRLAHYLREQIGERPTVISFKFARRGAAVEIYVIVDSSVLQDSAAVADLRQDRADIGKTLFPGQAVELHLCDPSFKSILVLRD